MNRLFLPALLASLLCFDLPLPAALTTNLVFTGTTPGDGTGDSARKAFSLINSNLAGLEASKLATNGNGSALTNAAGSFLSPSNNPTLRNLYATTGSNYLASTNVVEFATATTNASNPTVALRVHGASVLNGNVGIGTATPGARLEINDPSYATILLNSVNSDTSGPFGPGVIMKNTVAGAHPFMINVRQFADAYFNICNTEAPYTTYFSITQSGNVGIGVTLPSNKLEVAGNAYILGDLSCSNLIDLSSSPADLDEAVRIVLSLETKNGTTKVDHSKLDPAVWGTTTTFTDTGLKTTNIVAEIKDGAGNVTRPGSSNVVSVLESHTVPDQSKRNISMLVSAQALVLQDLLRRIELLEK